MTTLAADRDDVASLSSVPESAIDSDSEVEDMVAIRSSSAATAPASSAKAREAQAESERTRQARQPAMAGRASMPSQNAGAQMAVQPAIDPDEIPPPPYTEALRQPASRPDDGVRYAWRQGIAEGSLDMSSFNRLLSPTQPQSDDAASQVFDAAVDREAHPEATSPDPRAQATSPILDLVRSVPDYGTSADPQRHPRRGRHHHHRHHDHRHHDGLPDERYHDRPGSRSRSASDSRSDSPSSFRHHLHRHIRRKLSSEQGRKRRCFNWRRHDVEDFEPRWDERYKHRQRRRLLKFGLIVVVFLLVMMAVKILTTKWAQKEPQQPLPENPGGGSGERPTVPGSPSSGVIIVPPSLRRQPKCPGARWGEYLTWYSSSDTVHVTEALNDVRVTGLIRLAKGTPDQEQGIIATIAYATNPDEVVPNAGLAATSSGFRVNAPHGANNPYSSQGSCIDMDIIAFIRPGYDIKDINIETVHLSVEVQEGLFANGTIPGFHADGTASISTTSGKVQIPYLSARRIIIRTKSGKIEGAFSLYDLLSLRTVSGAISGSIDPKPAEDDDPTHPADLDLGSSSGRLDVSVNTHGTIPNRVYKTNVETQSSAISGTFIAGRDSKFASHSGRLEAELVPYIFIDPSEEEETIVPPTRAKQPKQPTPPTPPMPAQQPDTPDTPDEPFFPEDFMADFLNMPNVPAVPRIPKIPKIPRIPKIPKIPEIPKIPRTPRTPDFNPDLPPFFPIPGSDFLHDPNSVPSPTHLLRLQTSNTASATSLKVRDPVTVGKLANTSYILLSGHQSSSGRIDLVYPASWAGTLETHSTSGKIEVSGDRLERIGSNGHLPWDGIRIGSRQKWERMDEDWNKGRNTLDVGTVSSAVSVKFL